MEMAKSGKVEKWKSEKVEMWTCGNAESTENVKMRTRSG